MGIPKAKIRGTELGQGAEGESVGRQIYKHLINGVSHMLPFVMGGGNKSVGSHRIAGRLNQGPIGFMNLTLAKHFVKS